MISVRHSYLQFCRVCTKCTVHLSVWSCIMSYVSSPIPSLRRRLRRFLWLTFGRHNSLWCYKAYDGTKPIFAAFMVDNDDSSVLSLWWPSCKQPFMHIDCWLSLRPYAICIMHVPTSWTEGDEEDAAPLNSVNGDTCERRSLANSWWWLSPWLPFAPPRWNISTSGSRAGKSGSFLPVLTFSPPRQRPTWSTKDEANPRFQTWWRRPPFLDWRCHSRRRRQESYLNHSLRRCCANNRISGSKPSARHSTASHRQKRAISPSSTMCPRPTLLWLLNPPPTATASAPPLTPFARSAASVVKRQNICSRVRTAPLPCVWRTSGAVLL